MMSARPTCDDVFQITAELALGIASGEERARALRHIAGCPRCRRELAELAELADELLLMAPDREPPRGFESQVLERVGGSTTSSSRLTRWLSTGWRRVLVPGTAALVTAGVAVGVMREVTEGDREAASHYRRALEQANGSYFGALPLRDRFDRRAGLVFGYEGRPSWVLVLVQKADRSARWEVVLETRRDGRSSLGSFEVSRGGGSFGRAIPMALSEVKRVTMVERGRGGRLVAATRPRE
jgi:hypothetical protein